MTARICSGDAYFSVYEVTKNEKLSYSFSFAIGSPKYNKVPTSDVIVIPSGKISQKIFWGLISPWNKLLWWYSTAMKEITKKHNSSCNS